MNELMEKAEPVPFKPIVAINDIEDFRSDGEKNGFGDRRDGMLYRYTFDVKLAINVALATGRPLLILGETGCGKSSLAFNLARRMKRRYYEFVVTSRSQARDLFYRFDAIRRLGDSQMGDRGGTTIEGAPAVSEPIWRMQFPYIEPGPLWWILDPAGAKRRGYSHTGELPFVAAEDPAIWPQGNSCSASSILLLDEIDKAEPDFPNNLLVPLGSRQFIVEEIAKTISIDESARNHDPVTQPLIIITSNQQRELPDTFVRRCIVLKIPPPEPEQLVELATVIFGSRNDQLYWDVATPLADSPGKQLSVAEFLDAVQAIQQLSASEKAQIEIIKRSSWRSVEI